MRIFLSTGDISGEQHAARLVREFATTPDVKFSAMGSAPLRAAGAEVVVDNSAIKVMGFVAIVKHLPAIYFAFQKVLAHLDATRPDAVVLVDYPGFNLRLAKAVKKRFPSMKVIYYITPQVWAWHQSRVKIIQRYVDYCLCILPFEPEFFARHGIRAEYVGSPVADATRSIDRSAGKRILGLSDATRLISIFPGSRRKELQYLLPPMIDAARTIYEQFDDVAFALAAAPGYTVEDLQAYCAIPGWLTVLENRNLELLASSYFCFAKSGTTTLEAALLDCPLLVAYRGDWLSAKIARAILALNPQIKYISLPNLIGGKPVVPELLQENCNGAELARIARLLLKDEETYAGMRRDLQVIKHIVGDQNSAAVTAAAILLELRVKS
ncbi:lipid-A-disaccharide synthase [Planctomycetales bacterium]|nr:lipid-A-disaccharide synthase [Planctomycetales bacterium]GHS96923.1 lipid-A-disaccharide synthase [Planctomycetales bacterium]